MDVQEPELPVARVAEPVDGADRRRHPRPRGAADHVAVDRELGLALEDVERVDVVVVRVRIRPLEARLERELDQRELLAPDLDCCDAVVRDEPLTAITWPATRGTWIVTRAALSEPSLLVVPSATIAVPDVMSASVALWPAFW